MQFWLAYNNFAESLQLPVNPSSFELQQGMRHTTINIAELGDITQIGGVDLAKITLAGILPGTYGRHCEYQDIPDPYEAVELIERWAATKEPIRLIITDTPINLACSIESFNYGERAGSRDVEYTLALKEYRFIIIETVGSDADGRPSDKAVPSTYTVKSGDTLWMIAKMLTGDGDNWSAIYEANEDTIGADPNMIHPGQELVIDV